MDILQIINVILNGIVEGITEWLPVSSTGHMILLQSLWPLNFSKEFNDLFTVVIQLGAILAVFFIFWRRLWPFGGKKSAEQNKDNMIGVTKNVYLKKNSLHIWWMVIIACIPTAILGFFLDDLLSEYLFNALVVAIMLIVYGIAFIAVEIWNKNRTPRIDSVAKIDYKTALLFGLFQALAMIPGTSRSGATIIGALIIGVSRTTAAEFTFFLAIPTMFGASLLKFVKYFMDFGTAGLGASEITALVLGMVVAFAVSLAVIKFLMDFVRKHDFKVFGYYRIALGVVVLIVFGVLGKLLVIM